VSHAVEYEFPSFSATDSGLTFLRPFERIVLSEAPASEVRNAYQIPDSVRHFWTMERQAQETGKTESPLKTKTARSFAR